MIRRNNSRDLNNSNNINFRRRNKSINSSDFKNDKNINLRRRIIQEEGQKQSQEHEEQSPIWQLHEDKKIQAAQWAGPLCILNRGRASTTATIGGAALALTAVVSTTERGATSDEKYKRH